MTLLKRITQSPRHLALLSIPAVFGIYAALYAVGGRDALRAEVLVLPALVAATLFFGALGRRLFSVLAPFLLTGLIYDSMRYWADAVRGPIRVWEPYTFDWRFFGITTANGVLTPNEWWQLHTHWILDFFTGLAYLTFIFVYIATVLYFVFGLSRRGTARMSASDITHEVQGMPWGFLWVNLIGYSTYYWYAAAPPWFVSDYGLIAARLDVTANPAGCLRFDALLGTQFFTGMYGRSADVFGAIPSLHVAYPLMAALYASRFGKWEIFSWVFYALMCFSAVYLNHHYVLDILWGSAYALIVYGVIQLRYRRS